MRISTAAFAVFATTSGVAAFTSKFAAPRTFLTPNVAAREFAPAPLFMSTVVEKTAETFE